LIRWLCWWWIAILFFLY